MSPHLARARADAHPTEGEWGPTASERGLQLSVFLGPIVRIDTAISAPGCRRTASLATDVAGAPRDEKRLIASRYHVIEELGRGGAALVMRVYDALTDREVALKRLLSPCGSDHPSEVACLHFRREFHTLAAVRHPGIVEAYDYGVDERGPYYTMELLDGGDLLDAGRMSLSRVVEVLSDVAAALSFLHARQVVHRDVSPRNVRCTRDGRAKLIDLGIMCTAGATARPAGTPPFMAPESLRGSFVDQRADVFGLGAMAYRLLTGGHAYPAAALDDLPAMWSRDVEAPSASRAEVPETLDRLVLSMIDADPMARPATMAEVLDRLAVLGEPRPDGRVARSVVRCSALVGRDEERETLALRVRRAAAGEGSAVLIAAPNGLGKTRLLREARVLAQLRGLVVAETTAREHASTPYGVGRELLLALRALAPDATAAAIAEADPAIAASVPELGLPAFVPDDPQADPKRPARALGRLLLEVARRQPIAIVIDDLQRADAASIGALAVAVAEGADAPLFLVASVRTDERSRAAHALEELGAVSTTLALPPLDEAQIRRLVVNAIGDVAGVAKLTHWLDARADGSPMLCQELLRWLLEEGRLRYRRGAWSIQEPPVRDEIPDALCAVMDRRLAQLTPSARAVGEALAVHGGAVDLATCVWLSGIEDEADVFDALDELAFHDVLVEADGWFRSRHDAAREALLRGLDAPRRQHLHDRVARHLLDSGSDDDALCWHLFHAGRSREAAPRLERIGRRLYDSMAFSDCVAPLEAALVAYGPGVSARVELPVRKMLVGAAATWDPSLVGTHAEPAIEQLRYWSGVDVATRVGGALGLCVGLVVATARWLLRRAGGPNPFTALAELVATISYATVCFAGCFDVTRARAVSETLAAFESLPRSVLGGAYLLGRSVADMPAGRFRRIPRATDAVLRVLASRTGLRDVERQLGRGTMLYAAGFTRAIDQDPTHEALASGLDALGPRFETAAMVTRLSYLRVRGDEALARDLEREVEDRLRERGTGWVFENHALWASLLGYAACRDVAGLRRTSEAFERLAATGRVSGALAALARGEHLRERGNLVEAFDALTLARSLLPDEDRIHRPIVDAALAETALSAGDHDAAMIYGMRGLMHATPNAETRPLAVVRCAVALAVAKASAGMGAEASAPRDLALSLARRLDCPSLLVRAHLGASRCAELEDATATAHHHRVEAERFARATGNPALVAQLRVRRRRGSGAPPGHAEEAPTTERRRAS